MSDDPVVSAGGDTGSVATSHDSSSPTAIAEHPESSETAVPSGSSAEPGPVPYPRFKDINDRYNALRWAESHDADTVSQQQAFFQWLDRDPPGAFRYMQDYLTRAGALPSTSTEPPARPMASITIPETGQKFYTAEDADQLVAWALKGAEDRFNSRLQPIEQQITLGQAQREAARQVSEAETWPHYKEFEGSILQEMERDKRLSLDGAYRRVVLPKLRQLERQAVLEEMKVKPAASTHNPGSSVATTQTPVSKLGWTELFQREMQKRR